MLEPHLQVVNCVPPAFQHWPLCGASILGTAPGATRLLSLPKVRQLVPVSPSQVRRQAWLCGSRGRLPPLPKKKPLKSSVYACTAHLTLWDSNKLTSETGEVSSLDRVSLRRLRPLWGHLLYRAHTGCVLDFHQGLLDIEPSMVQCPRTPVCVQSNCQRTWRKQRELLSTP